MGYYVYKLIDPRDCSCFYIGKGKGRRAWDHQGSARSVQPDNHRKRSRILAILLAGQSVTVEIVARFDDERMAYAHEYDLIQSTENLTNIAPGRAPPPTREEIIEARRLAIIARRLAEIERRKQGRKAQYQQFVKGLPHHLQRVASEWLDGLSEQAEPTFDPRPYISKPRLQKPRKKREGSIRKNRRKHRRQYGLKIMDCVALPPLPSLPPKL
jgi:hypothetical protein